MMKYLPFFVCALALSLVSCHSNSSQSASSDTVKPNGDGIAVMNESSEVTVTGIRDLENSMSVDLFKGSCPDSLLKRLAPEGSFKSAINVYLAISDDYLVLFDAGLGADKGGKLLEKLAYLHVSPEEIDAIFLTHLHADHIGGLLKDGKLVFPNATIYLSVDEFNAWNDNGPMASQNALWKKVLASYALQVQPFNDGDRLLDGLVTARLAPGHTPGHTIYTVGNNLIVGDLLHAQDLQLTHPECCARYDNNSAQAVTTRKEVLQYAKENGLYLSGAHCYDFKIDVSSL